MSDFATCGMTEEEVYRAFQEYLDKFGFGYCAVEGGHEMAMLKKFYTYRAEAGRSRAEA